MNQREARLTVVRYGSMFVVTAAGNSWRVSPSGRCYLTRRGREWRVPRRLAVRFDRYLSVYLP